MAWELEEALAYYKTQGAPRDQLALVNLLKEIQGEQGLTPETVTRTADAYGVQESFLLAIIRRYPSLRLRDTHCLEICGGPNCSRKAGLYPAAEEIFRDRQDVTLRLGGCMRMCGKGPNLKWDGKLYSGADIALLKQLAGKL